MGIDQQVKDIILHVLSARRSFEKIDDDNCLTGPPLQVSGEEIVYIVLELMEKFQIVFDSSDFDDYKFNTIAGIISAVNRHI